MKNAILFANYFILTGGPGSGKTSVLHELEQRGYHIVPEVARAIIKHQQAHGGNAIHTGDRDAFLELMLEQSIVDYSNMQLEKAAVFFDRGIPDLYGYSKTFCGGLTATIQEAVSHFRYNKTVFLFPPWAEIYVNDSERQQDFAEALKTYHAVKSAYQDCDYFLVEMPKTSVMDRADFIIKMLCT